MSLSTAHSAPSHPPAPQGQEVGTPVLQAHTYKEYNSEQQVWTITQDRRGLIYIGVTGGTILEYDGATWRHIFTPMNAIRSLTPDDSGRIWVTGSGNFGYLAPDAVGALHFVSLLDRVSPQDRHFTHVWQALSTPQGVFFRAYEMLFRWDGSTMHTWSTKSRFQALSAVRGHVYTDQNGIGLQEIVADELRNLPGGDAYSKADKLILHPYDDGRLVVSQREGPLTLYDGQKVTPFPTSADDYLQKSLPYISILMKNGDLCVTTLNGGSVILQHDGTLRQLIDTADGLPDSGTLSAFEDREGALWLGTATAVIRVEAGSPVSIFDRSVADSALRFQGSVYTTGGTTALQRLVSDPKTHRPSFATIAGSSQGFSINAFKDPSGKTPDQQLVATSDGVLKLQGDALVPVISSLKGPTEQAYRLLLSRKNPSRMFIGHSDGVASIRWYGQKWIDEVGSTDWLLSFVVPSCTRHDSHPEDLKHCAHKIRSVSIRRSLPFFLISHSPFPKFPAIWMAV